MIEIVSYGCSVPTAIVDNTIHRIEQIPSHDHLLNVAVYLLRFTGRSLLKGQIVPSERKLVFAFERNMQISFYSKAITKLKANRDVKTRFRKLQPYIDENGILCVGGRLEKSLQTTDRKHRIILFFQHHDFFKLYVRHLHLSTGMR